MKTFAPLALAASLAASLGAGLVAAPAIAQDALTGDDARAFLEDVQPQAQQAVDAGEWQGIQSWMAENVADDAQLQFTGEIIATEGPSLTFSGSMEGSDLAAFAGRGMGGPQNGGMDVVTDYYLEVEVMATWELPNGQVAAAVAFYEHGAVAEGAGMPVSGAFSSATDCALRMEGAGEDLRIVLANCKIDANV